MINRLLTALNLRDEPTLRDRLRDLIDDRPSYGRSILSAFRPVRSGARRAASRTSSFVVANPRKVGLGVGAAAALAIGIYAIARSQENRTQDVREGAQVEPAE